MAGRRATGDLFEAAGRERAGVTAPLAERLRPESLDEVVGQEALLAPDALLRREVQAGRLASLILWGPPGCGKTTLARLLAAEAGFELVRISAVSAGVAEVRRVLADASSRLGGSGRRTLFFVDEIHRFHKGQQDALLHEVEDGRVVLVGATTENPAFHLNRALLSRCRLLHLAPLSETAAAELLARGLADPRGLGGRLGLEDEARDELVRLAEGDARRLLNHLERAAQLASAGGAEAVGPRHVRDALGARVPGHDRGGDLHHDLLSGLHKSLRGSDPDAAAYYVQRLLVAGEDPLVVARRMVRMASEDIGLADPRALRQALDATEAVRFLGMPEGDAALVQAAVYLALAPKSDAVYRAANEARRAAEQHGALPVPPSLTGVPNRPDARPYDNPHGSPGHVNRQQHLPDRLRDAVFYRPTRQGFEIRLGELLADLRRRRGAPSPRRETGPDAPAGPRAAPADSDG